MSNEAGLGRSFTHRNAELVSFGVRLNNHSYPPLFTGCLHLLSVHACMCSESRDLQIFPHCAKCVNGLYSSHCLLSKARRACTKQEPRHGWSTVPFVCWGQPCSITHLFLPLQQTQQLQPKLKIIQCAKVAWYSKWKHQTSRLAVCEIGMIDIPGRLKEVLLQRSLRSEPASSTSNV